MKIKVHLSIGFPTATHTDILEMDDDYTEEDIHREVEEWANNYIEISWDEVK